MADNWEEVRLGDLIEIRHGFAFAGEYFQDDEPGDLLLTPGNFAVGGGFQAGKAKYYRGPVASEFVLSPGDLLVTMTDLSRGMDTLGYPAFVPDRDSVGRYLHNQRLGKVVIKPHASLEQRYLYYLLCSREYRNEVLASATGTTVKHTSPSRIGGFRFRLPPRHVQKAVGDTLGSLDDKIELNRRINVTLEAMARALFKSWFVDFEPVRAKAEGRSPGLPHAIADLFSGRFEDSGPHEVPAGWRVGRLGDLAQQSRRGVQPGEIDKATPYIALEHMPRRSIALAEWATALGLESNKFRFRRGEILFGKLRPYFHKVGVAPVDGVCSTDIVVLTPRAEAWFCFVLGTVSSDAFVEYTSAGSTGTKMPRTSWGEMERYPLVVPPDPVAQALNEHMRPLVDRIIASIHEGRTLAAIRDTLLPILVSGGLRVPEAEGMPKAAAV